MQDLIIAAIILFYLLCGVIVANFYYSKNKIEFENVEYEDYYDQRARESLISICLVMVTVIWPIYLIVDTIKKLTKKS